MVTMRNLLTFRHDSANRIACSPTSLIAKPLWAGWAEMMKCGMGRDFGWERSVRLYQDEYRKLLERA